FAIYADSLGEVTPIQIGLAIGIYGLTQAMLQIPFGMASDRWGRKPVIIFGLLIFIMGSIFAANAETIQEIIIGRALQGAGAVAAAVMALLSDLTQEEHRTKAMAMVGMSIGFSFVAAMVLGPLLNGIIGVPGLFGLTAILGGLGIIMLIWIVPNPKAAHFHHDTEAKPALFGAILKDSQLMRLNFGIFTLHMVLSASFIAIPFMLRDSGLAGNDQWMLYLPVLVLAMAVIIPFIIIAEKRRKMKLVFVGAIALLMLVQAALAWVGAELWVIGILLWLFFSGFNLLEASLPSLVSKFAPAASRGTAMGVYSTSQFLGAFSGGVLGGSIYGVMGANGLFMLCSAALALWFIVALSMQQPRYLKPYLIKVGAMSRESAQGLEKLLREVAGVAEVTIDGSDEVAYLKVDSQKLDQQRLDQIIQQNSGEK
ncbi:MAG: MFS transporter, partial [Chromatiales bacterium]|nr:MFS transporter [Chromatiales bacterium]